MVKSKQEPGDDGRVNVVQEVSTHSLPEVDLWVQNSSSSSTLYKKRVKYVFSDWTEIIRLSVQKNSDKYVKWKSI